MNKIIKIVEKYGIDQYVALLALCGTILNVYQLKVCFFIWFFTNGFWAFYNYFVKKSFSQAGMNIAYWILSVIGILTWR